MSLVEIETDFKQMHYEIVAVSYSSVSLPDTVTAYCVLIVFSFLFLAWRSF